MNNCLANCGFSEGEPLDSASMPPFPDQEKWPCPSHRNSNTLRFADVDLRRRRSVFPAPLSCVRQRLDSATFFFLPLECAFDTPGMSIYSKPFLDGTLTPSLIFRVVVFLVVNNGHLDPRLIHCVQEFLDFLLAHSNSENRVPSKRNA